MNGNKYTNLQTTHSTICTGHDPQKLKTIIELTVENRKQAATALKTEREQHEEQIANYKGDDPLEPWLGYITWTQDAFPSGNGRLVELLEECCRTFKDNERYKNDERYLKVWLMYADLCCNPIDIFMFFACQ